MTATLAGRAAAKRSAVALTIIEVSGCAERGLVARLAARCSPASLAARFFRPVSGAADRNLLTLLLGPATGRAFLALDAGRPVGLVNLAPGDAGEVEVALLVADRWQHRGVGRALLEHALADPRWAAETVHVTVRPENTAVLALLHTLPRALRLVDTAPGELYFDLCPSVVEPRPSAGEGRPPAEEPRPAAGELLLAG
ncbi:MAG TPA: GNAT family N-acetyltransferase [Pseudonocardia sp.]|nr:GNAT family N-acetyltransferase [Pseudonocardia sp.]